MIRMLRNWSWRDGLLRKGQELTLPPNHERRLVEDGNAEYVTEQKIETAAENAPKRRGRPPKRKTVER